VQYGNGIKAPCLHSKFDITNMRQVGWHLAVWIGKPAVRTNFYLPEGMGLSDDLFYSEAAVLLPW